jgi:methylmalonyl-CoA mutase N-terminal domain/subunit
MNGSIGRVPTRRPWYSAQDLLQTGFEEGRDLGQPGQFPFTRGTAPGEQGLIRPLNAVYAGFSSPRSTNARYRRLIELGADALAMAVDLPTQVGLDSDDEMAFGEVGRVGVPVSSLRDMETIFDGIDLSCLRSVGMLGNAIGPIALAMFVALGEQQGLRPSQYVVELQNDVLKEYVSRGTQILPLTAGVRLCTDVVAWCADHAPGWRPITVCSNHIEAAGADAPVAQAMAVANALCYIDRLAAGGYQPARILPKISLFINERADFYAAIANFRACRRLWARLISERYGIDPADREALALRLTSYAHGGETRAEAQNNIVRNALMALAAHLGGAEFLNIASMDEALNLPSGESAALAVRTNQVLSHELHIHDVSDPLGGSFFIETLTTQVEDAMRETLATIQDGGGAIAATGSGLYLELIADGADRRRRARERGEVPKVGVDLYVDKSAAEPASTFTQATDAADEHLAGLARLRESRDDALVRASLKRVEDAVRGDENVVPSVIEAVKAYATVGEICEVWRQVLGEWRPDGTF